ncbi:hypothetical protein HK099_000030 [Clydaea vesicula]|uniref:GS catalytic domain-containing protein n=1 Tax=Clydaea vesicula TaxID=447962 RepID=A0AAD5U8E1_9FUNG|nr:hypothetical protein HK099_000030 [Clydaea vesicula]
MQTIGEFQLKPIISTLRQLPYYKNHSGVLTIMVQRNGERFSRDPRFFLEKGLDLLKKKFGITLKAGFEIEFTLYTGFDESGNILPLDETVYSETAAFNPKKGGAAEIMDKIVKNLKEQGIEVTMFHAESANGQFEIALEYGDVLNSADNLIFTKETIKHVAALYGVNATFVSKVFANQAANSCHLHLSLWRNGNNITAANSNLHSGKEALEIEDLSEETRKFIAGLLKNLPALCSITMPNPNSYLRLADYCWAGAWKCWGFENREAPIRICSPNGKLTNFEVKCFDGFANPYLGIGAIVFCALEGLENDLSLPPPCNLDPADFETVLEVKNLKLERLPNSLEVTLHHLEKNEVLRKGMQTDLFETFLKIKWHEVEFLKTSKNPVSYLAKRY